MINKNELRLGNWVIFNDDTDRYGQVSEIHERYPILRCDYIPDHYENRIKECLIDYEFVHGIPITPEILEKAGFEWLEEVGGHVNNHHVIYERTEDWRFDPYCTIDSDLHLSLKYLHQLQNLIFALTSEELEITL